MLIISDRMLGVVEGGNGGTLVTLVPSRAAAVAALVADEEGPGQGQGDLWALCPVRGGSHCLWGKAEEAKAAQG